MNDGKHMSIAKAKPYFIERAKELEWMCTHGTPWVFLCTAALLDLLASMVTNECQNNGENFCHYKKEEECRRHRKNKNSRLQRGGGCRYQNFVKEYMPMAYSDFSYNDTDDNAKDLPRRMWNILRCGVIHNFSLTPGYRGEQDGLEAETETDIRRTIVLCHRKEVERKGWWHLCAYSVAERNAALFIAEDFVEDLRNVIVHIFAKAERDQELKRNIERWLKSHPPIAGGV